MAFYDTDYNQLIRKSSGGRVVQDAQQRYNSFTQNVGSQLQSASQSQEADAAKRILDLYNFAVQNGFNAAKVIGIEKLHGQIYESMITDFLKEKNLLEQGEAQAGIVNSAKSKGFTGNTIADAFGYLDSWNAAAAVADKAGLSYQPTTSLQELSQIAQNNQQRFNQAAQGGTFNNANESSLAFKEYAPDGSDSQGIRSVLLTTPDGKQHRVEVGSAAEQKYRALGAQEGGSSITKTNGILYENGQPITDQTKLAQYYSSVPEGGSVAVGSGTAATGQNGPSGGTPGATASGATTGFTPTGNPVLDQTLGELQNYLKELEKRGQVLNPNITLDAKTLAEFTKQAEAEINPYYANQLKAARESLLTGAGYSRDELLKNEQALERQYSKNFTTLGENAADQGFALSGIRQKQEGELAQDTQNTIDTNRRSLDFNLGNTAREFAQAYGTANTPSLNIGNAPSVTGGETGFSSGNGSRSLYSLDPAVYDGLVGSKEFEQRGAVRNRASQLEEAFRSNAGIQQQRALTL